ncbi:MAG TPA: class I SAM-dependent methyltransferase [Anaerolineales bacterium]|nr:class I SAM-dependent methyltransferase [Anaerolineales bacterium]
MEGRDMKEIKKYTDQNRRAWDEIAEVRYKGMKTAEFFARGGCLLNERVLEVAGDVHGLKLCHLQCSTGEDTLSWATRGAHVTGVDISPKQIELAQQKAVAAGLPARFIASDIYALPTQLFAEKFDILFTGGGAIVWLPDLQRWARIIVQLLKPSGRIVIDESHPIAGCMEVQNGQVRFVEDYFGRKPEMYVGWSHFSGAENAVEKKYEFMWPLGDIVTALAQAGLRIELLEERPSQAQWRFGDKLNEVARIPGEYLLVARKDRNTE